MNILVTTSRMPFASEEIRQLGKKGHKVFAADTYRLAAGSHSRFACEHLVYPSPRLCSSEFVAAVRQIIEEHEIELIVPTFEEGFYLSAARASLPRTCRLFAPDMQTVRTLHEKSSFLALVERLHLPVPATQLVNSAQEMQQQMTALGDYFARPVSSRGGMELLTNRGILRGRIRFEDCVISPERPWIIQPFVEGPELCTFSIAFEGRLLAHLTYRHPMTLGDSGGIAFESIDSSETLPIVEKIAAATHLTGQFGLDFIETASGLSLGECNPRATAGVSLLPSGVFAEAVTTPEQAELFVCPAGRRRQIAIGLLFDSLLHWRKLPKNLSAFFHSGDDIYGPKEDVAPALYSLLSFTHLLKFQHQMPQEAQFDLDDMVRSQFYDVLWDPQPHR